MGLLIDYASTVVSPLCVVRLPDFLPSIPLLLRMDRKSPLVYIIVCLPLSALQVTESMIQFNTGNYSSNTINPFGSVAGWALGDSWQPYEHHRNYFAVCLLVATFLRLFPLCLVLFLNCLNSCLRLLLTTMPGLCHPIASIKCLSYEIAEPSLPRKHTPYYTPDGNVVIQAGFLSVLLCF
jgi:hypothetical protein